MKSTAQPTHFYRDPMEVAMARQERTCKGCAHERVFEFAGSKVAICNKGKQHGRRCKHYAQAGAKAA
jgi:hypothetical protein